MEVTLGRAWVRFMASHTSLMAAAAQAFLGKVSCSHAERAFIGSCHKSVRRYTLSRDVLFWKVKEKHHPQRCTNHTEPKKKKITFITSCRWSEGANNRCTLCSYGHFNAELQTAHFCSKHFWKVYRNVAWCLSRSRGKLSWLLHCLYAITTENITI